MASKPSSKTSHPAPPPAAETPMNPTAAKLLVAAGDLMTEKNSVDISLSDIAQRSGINAALVKYHFGNKEGLLLALLARDARAEMVNLKFLVDQPISPTEKMRLQIAGIINANYRFPYMNRLIHFLLNDSVPETSREVVNFFVKPLLDLERRILEEGFAAGEFREVDPALFYVSLVGACDHLFYRRRSFSDAAAIAAVNDDVRRRYIAHMTEMTLGGLLATGNNAARKKAAAPAARRKVTAIESARKAAAAKRRPKETAIKK
jgi:AcrR family transcriptional regulator